MDTGSTTYFALSYCDWSIEAWIKNNPNTEIDELSVAVSGEGAYEQARFFILYRGPSKESE
ncbi:MAG: hypothetical protein AB7T06_07035 [Kofleriaceae bacterium]